MIFVNKYDVALNQIRTDIINSPSNQAFTKKGWEPIYTASSQSKIVIVGQAPGLNAQESNSIWNDQSGDRLREWLGVSREQFYNTNDFALIPVDFYFPGKAKTGDKPPRKDFADKWLPKIFNNLVNVKLIILVGTYSQKYYLKHDRKENLTETVRAYKDYLPQYFPLSHPSPLNFRWRNKNPWFELNVIPYLKELVVSILNS